MIKKNKIKGLIFGCAIGDALGMPVESFSKEKISAKHNKVVDYIQPIGHKWFNGKEAGTTTDDTSLLTATIESIIDSNGLDMDSQVKWHIKAIQKSDEGMGDTTRFALNSLIKDKHWSESGFSGDGRGLGNGVAMKVSPIAAYLAIKAEKNFDKFSRLISETLSFIIDYNNMTHKTKISLIGAAAIFYFALDCLLFSSDGINIYDIKNRCLSCFYLLENNKKIESLYLEKDKDDLISRLLELFDNHENWSIDDIVNKYNGGYCYVYDSVPFSLYFFLNNPNSVDALYDVINAGGDTDTNGAIVGSLLGALNGIEIFPKHLIDGLKEKDYLNDLCERFCSKFAIED